MLLAPTCLWRWNI